MTAKEYLNQAKHLDALIKSHLREIEYWRELSLSVQSRNFEIHHNPNRPTEAPFVKCLEKMDEIQRNVEDKISDMLQIKEEISMAIDQLENGEERLLLRYRYLDGLSWEEIEQKMFVSKSTVHRIHGSALQNLSVPDEMLEHFETF